MGFRTDPYYLLFLRFIPLARTTDKRKGPRIGCRGPSANPSVLVGTTVTVQTWGDLPTIRPMVGANQARNLHCKPFPSPQL